MSDALKRAHEAIKALAGGPHTSTEWERLFTEAHAALDAAVEEARGQDAVRSVDCEAALSAERERVLREVVDALNEGPILQADENLEGMSAYHQWKVTNRCACVPCTTAVAIYESLTKFRDALLKEPAQECPTCRSDDPKVRNTGGRSSCL